MDQTKIDKSLANTQESVKYVESILNRTLLDYI